ncbi:MAG: hypothetical protein CBC82_02985, partial [Cellvibrionales bacterium TMED122]
MVCENGKQMILNSESWEDVKYKDEFFDQDGNFLESKFNEYHDDKEFVEKVLRDKISFVFHKTFIQKYHNKKSESINFDDI